MHVISTGQQSPEELLGILEQIHPFTDYIHLREKTWTDHDWEKAMDSLTQRGIPSQKIIINQRIDIAHRMKAKGVQLTHQSIDPATAKHSYGHLRIGCSVHSVSEAVTAENSGADYLVYGHIFASASKPDLTPKGLQKLTNVTQNTSVPVIAIGGITPENTPDVLASGASGIAVLSGILLDPDPLEAIQRYQHQLHD
ncbi:thiazole tautomerase TenI [Lentibacillus halophilus]|uniref:Thiazole tautomerase TenI n=1 Tax=Lentibacillus halophilus TaxID=295065 RepID=A0ABN0Z121_9BACI